MPADETSFQEGRTVLVTGGTVRLGKAIADSLRDAGWRVVVSSHRPDAGADVVADLSSPGGAAKLFSACQDLLGGRPPDALVNNAALFAGSAAEIDAVNNVSPHKLTVLMAGRETGRGVVVNILDCLVLAPADFTDGNAYAKSKRDLASATVRDAAMFADTLRVNAVAPGPVLAPDGVHVKAGETPLGRPRPEDVVSAVAFLLGATATTGCILPVDGGQSAVSV